MREQERQIEINDTKHMKKRKIKKSNAHFRSA